MEVSHNAGRWMKFGWIVLLTVGLGLSAAWPTAPAAGKGSPEAAARGFAEPALISPPAKRIDIPVFITRNIKPNPPASAYPADAARHYGMTNPARIAYGAYGATSHVPPLPAGWHAAAAVRHTPLYIEHAHPFAASAAEMEPEPDMSAPAPTKPDKVWYEVTAYYLNVRAEPDKTSPIRDVLEQGDRIAVIGETDNGWLELENGLYVHGAYAVPADPPVEAFKGAREVTIASAGPPREQTAGHHDTRLPAQPEEASYTEDEIFDPQPLSRNVEAPSGFTEEAIARLLAGTELEGHGLETAVLEIEKEYGINALFTIAVMKLESGNGSSKLARSKNNLFGLNATGGSNSKAYSFETKSDSVYKFGSLIAKSYIGKGYTTIEKVGKKYCPANPKWASLVESIMRRDLRKLTRSV